MLQYCQQSVALVVKIAYVQPKGGRNNWIFETTLYPPVSSIHLVVNICIWHKKVATVFFYRSATHTKKVYFNMQNRPWILFLKLTFVCNGTKNAHKSRTHKLNKCKFLIWHFYQTSFNLHRVGDGVNFKQMEPTYVADSIFRVEK